MEMPLHASTSMQQGRQQTISSQAVKGWTEHVVRSQVAALISCHKTDSGLHVEVCTHIRNAGKPGEA
eukprot:1089786-Rhodomonas_salina.1